MPESWTFPKAGRALGVPLLLALPALLVPLVPGAAERLEYDRARIAAGEVWRLVTCHFAHWTPEHLRWDLAAAVALAAACGPLGIKRLAAALGGAAVTIPIAIWIALPAMSRYRGLSGLGSALFALLVVAVLRSARAEKRSGLALAAGVALGGFAAKLVWELATASPVFVGSGAGFVAVPLAHLVGAACGGCCALRALAGSVKVRRLRSQRYRELRPDPCRRALTSPTPPLPASPPTAGRGGAFSVFFFLPSLPAGGREAGREGPGE